MQVHGLYAYQYFRVVFNYVLLAMQFVAMSIAYFPDLKTLVLWSLGQASGIIPPSPKKGLKW